jgi:hypothetical protein
VPPKKKRKLKQVLSGGWYWGRGKGIKERVKKDEYFGSTMYSYMKME